MKMPGKKFKTVLIESEGDVTVVTLHRPELHNAFNQEMISELTQAFTQLSKDPKIRVILLTGAGNSFCAGADLHWMKKMARYSAKENVADAKRFHRMLLTIYRCSKPTLALVNGAAIGGGVGLVAAVDMALAHADAVFGFSEVRIGLIPAVISPFVLRKIGEGEAHEYFLTGERFSAMRAHQMGLVQYCGTAEEVREKLEQKISLLSSVAPQAVGESKKLIEKVSQTPLEQVGSFTAKMIAARRASPEGREGMNAFLNKRPPKWIKK